MITPVRKYLETETFNIDLAYDLYGALLTLFFSCDNHVDSFEITAIMLELGFIVRNPHYDSL